MSSKASVSSNILALDFFNCPCWNVLLSTDLTELFWNICIHHLHYLSDASLAVLCPWETETCVVSFRARSFARIKHLLCLSLFFLTCTQKPSLERSDGLIHLGWRHRIHMDTSVWIYTSKPIKEQTACQYPPDEAWTVNRRPRWKIKTSGKIVDEPL